MNQGRRLGVKLHRMTAVAGFALALTACGAKEDRQAAPAPQAAGLKDLDISKVEDMDGRKADAETLRTRRVNGLWRGAVAGDEIRADFGTDGTLSLMVMRGGSMTEQARGTWTWNKDNTLTGSLSGGRGRLSAFSAWSAGFPDTETMTVSGQGVTITLRRGRGAPAAQKGGPDVITADMLGNLGAAR